MSLHLLLIRDVNVQQITDVDVVMKQLNTKPLGNSVERWAEVSFFPPLPFLELALCSIVNGDVYSTPEPIVIKQFTPKKEGA